MKNVGHEGIRTLHGSDWYFILHELADSFEIKYLSSMYPGSMDAVKYLVKSTDIRVNVVYSNGDEPYWLLPADIVDVGIFVENDGLDLGTPVWLKDQGLELYAWLELAVQSHC